MAASPLDGERSFGRLLVEQGLAKQEHVDECLHELEILLGHAVVPLPKLGEIMMRKGYLSNRPADGSPAAVPGAETLPLPPAARTTIPLPPEAAAAFRNPRARIGAYVCGARLGTGGMGEVWKAWDMNLGRWVALKILKHDDPGEVARFTREAQASARLNHPNIGAVYEVGEHEGRHYIAMRWINGPTLQLFPRHDKRLIAELIRDVALAVHHAHENGIIHRDLKPANIMVEGDIPAPVSGSKSTHRRLKGHARTHNLQIFVLDFGLAKMSVADSSLSQTGYALGTPAYMPPEQAQGKNDLIGPRSDVYSLGATLYEALTGVPPFTGSNLYEIIEHVVADDPVAPRKLNLSMDRDLETIVLKAMDKDVDRRYSSALEFAEDLTRWLEGEPIAARPPSLTYKATKFVRRHWALTLAGAVLLLSLTTVATFAIADAHRAERERTISQEIEQAAHLINQIMVQQRSAKGLSGTHFVEQAETLLQGLIGRYPDSHQPHFQRARLRYTLSDYKGAEACATTSIGILPTAPALLLRGRIAWQRFQNEYRTTQHSKNSLLAMTRDVEAWRAGAITDFDRALRLTTSEDDRLYAEGLLALLQEDYSKAVARFTEGLRRSPSSEDLLYLRTVAHFGAFDMPAALQDADQLLTVWPDYFLAKLYRSSILAQLGRREEAIAILTRLLEENPDNNSARQERAVQLSYLGRVDEARRDLDALKARNLTPWVLTHILATTQTNAGNHREAIRLYDETLGLIPGEDHPKFWTVYSNRGWSKYLIGDHDGALKDFNYSLAHRDDPNAFVNRAQIKRDQGDFAGALADFDSAIRLRAWFGPTYFYRAQIHQKLGNDAKMADDLDRAIEKMTEDVRYDAQYVGAYVMRGDLRARSGDQAGAISDFSKAAARHPKNEAEIQAKIDKARAALPR